jgi:threonine dehydrogenase-like Zn-dependent dehydrogenase
MPIRKTHGVPPRPAPRQPATGALHVLPGPAACAWPAALAQLLPQGATVLVPATGPLSDLFADSAKSAGFTVTRLANPTEARLARHLGADRFGTIAAVLAVQGETDPTLIRRALDACFHDARLCLDASLTGRAAASAHADLVLTDPAAGLARLMPCQRLRAAP